MRKEQFDSGSQIRMGVVNKVVSVGSLMDETKRLAFKMTKQPPLALKMAKIAVNQGINMDIQSALTFEARCFEPLFSTEDQKEGMKAFAEKRKPVFKGR